MGGYGYAGAKTNLIANRPTCGGDKKAGLAPTIGRPITILTAGANRNSRSVGTNKPCMPPYLVRYSQPVQRKTLIY